MNLIRFARWAMLLAILACSGNGCSSCGTPCGGPDAAPSPLADAPQGGSWSHPQVANRSNATATVFISFGADSQVTTFPFCGDGGMCSFQLAQGASQDLPTGGAYLNATISFGAAPGCNVSLGEINISNSGWSQDTANISLVNGWNDDIEIAVTSPDGGVLLLGPTQGPNANAAVFGVYPNGCDICVAKQVPLPCGIQPCGDPHGSPPACGCKGGTQYNPTVPCQASFARSGAVVTVALVQLDAGVPASR